jgi:putative methyltransferase (TIGR04325 family)
LLGIFKTARKTPLDQGEKNIFWPVSFATYDQALAECSGGYSADLLLDSICARHKAFYHGSSDFPEVPWYLTAGLFAALPLAFSFLCKPLHVLDFGGSVGTHYVLATKCYPSIPIAKWAVVETEPFVARAREMDTDAFQFFNDISAAADWLGPVDLLTTAGALQYTADPIYFLIRLLHLRSPVFALQRCAFSLDDAFITIQRSMLSGNARGPLPADFVDREIRFPITFLNEADIHAICSKQYKSVLKILNEGEVMVAQRRTRSGDALIYSSRR